MNLKLDSTAIQIMNIFHEITGSQIIDCISDEGIIYIVVAKGQYGIAVGKNGAKVRNAEGKFNKTIKIIEHEDTTEMFIRNMIPDCRKISVIDKKVALWLNSRTRAKTIGRSGKNIKIIEVLLKRLYNIEELAVK